jgi:hypothetical protein
MTPRLFGSGATEAKEERSFLKKRTKKLLIFKAFPAAWLASSRRSRQRCPPRSGVSGLCVLETRSVTF